LIDNVEKMAGKNDKPRSLLGGDGYVSMTRWVLCVPDSTGEEVHRGITLSRHSRQVGERREPSPRACPAPWHARVIRSIRDT
jgi:hypothetical protein